MKKLVFMMFLMMGTLSFANSGKAVKNLKVKKSEAKVYYCTVGNVSVSSATCDCNACDRARAIYLAMC